MIKTFGEYIMFLSIGVAAFTLFITIPILAAIAIWGNHDGYYCPYCNEELMTLRGYRYCGRCKQHSERIN